MKTYFLRLFSGVAVTCMMLLTACTSTPPQPLTLCEHELTSSADTLYKKLCESGVLDKIAADWGSEKPRVDVPPVITSQLGSRNSFLKTCLFSARFVDLLSRNGHMVYGVETRADSQGVDINKLTGFDNGKGDASWDPTAMKSSGDYSLQCEIRSTETRMGDWLEIRYTLSAKLTDLGADDVLWSGSEEITRLREF